MAEARWHDANSCTGVSRRERFAGEIGFARLSKMKNNGPLLYDYSSQYKVDASTAGKRVLKFGRRSHLWPLVLVTPLFIFLAYLCVAIIVMFALAVWNELPIKGLSQVFETFVSGVFVAAFVGLGLYISIGLLWEILQELFNRTLEIDELSNRVSVGNVPFVRTRIEMNSIDGLELLLSQHHGWWCYLVVRVRGRRTSLRIMEVRGKRSSSAEQVADALQPVADDVAQQLGCEPPGRREISSWQCLWIWGI